jgi:ElaB/YqjD/DUF883 family membrane-anchored ribosome-binding protein
MTVIAEPLSKADDKTVERVRAGTHEALEKAAEIARQAADILYEKGEQMKHLEEQFLENCRTYVHDQPVTSLAIAVGLSSAQFALARVEP